jgi:hypothetical protein
LVKALRIETTRKEGQEMNLYLALQETVDDDDFDINESTIVWVLLVVLLVVLIVYVVNRIR